MTASHTLATEDLTLGYDGRAVVEGLDPTLAAGRITVIVGANACGKPTPPRSMSRLLVPRTGRAVLDGREVHRTPAPHAHQRAFSRRTAQDDAAVAAALKATHTTGLHRTRGTTVVMMDSRVVEDPGSGEPLVLPIGRHHSTAAGSGIAAAGSR